MSQYTTQLRYVIEMNSDMGKDPALSPWDRCTKAAPKIFNFDFPIWDESLRTKFESEFLLRFYTEEICAETVGLWQVMLQQWFTENMPFWNARFKAVMTEFNFLDEYDYLEKANASDNENTNGTSNSNQSQNAVVSNMNKYYEVPSRNIVSIDGHLNNATSDESKNNATSTVENAYKDTKVTTHGNEVHRQGRQSSPADLLTKYFDAVLNVKSDFYKDASVLFMQLW